MIKAFENKPVFKTQYFHNCLAWMLFVKKNVLSLPHLILTVHEHQDIAMITKRFYFSSLITKLLTVVIISLIGCEKLIAWQLPVTNYSQKEYAAGTQTWQIKQQHNGWIYCANNYGLLEFDGDTWQHYGIWNSTVIRSLDIASDGTVYVGGTNEFGCFRSNPLGMLSYEPLSNSIPDKYRNFGEVWNIMSLNNDLYVQTRHYIFKFNQQAEPVVIEVEHPVHTAAKIGDGIYVATSEGIYLLSGTQLNALHGSDLLHGRYVCSLRQYGKNGLLIGTDFDGLFLFDGHTITRFVSEADAFIQKNQLYSMDVGDRYIALGTVLNGLVITDLSGKNCRYVNTQNGLQNNTVLCASFDANNNLWLGLDRGIDRIIIDSPIAELYGYLNSYGSGYTAAIKGNIIYLGSNQGLYSTDYPPSSQGYQTSLKLIDGSLGQVWELDTIGATLFCAHHRGLFTVENGAILPVSQEGGFWRVRQLHADKNRAIAGSYSGLYLLTRTNGQWHIAHKIKGFNATSKMFELDTDDRIWVVSNRGVDCLTLNSDGDSCQAESVFQFRHQSDYFNIDKIDSTVIISNSSICRTVTGGEAPRNDSAFFALLDGNKCYSLIKKDMDNNLWYISDKALKVRVYNAQNNHYEKQSIQIWNIPNFVIDGFANLIPIGNGQVIAGTTLGFTLGDKNNAMSRQNTPRSVSVRRIYSTIPKDSVIYGQSFPAIDSKIVIPYINNSIRIEFCRGIVTDESDEFRVQLLPLDTGYGAWGTSKIKEYTSLREGTYTFHVQMRSNMNDSISHTVVTFKINTPWYRSWWSSLIKIMMALAFGYAIYRYIMRKIEIGKRKLTRLKDAEMRKQELEFIRQTHRREKEILRLTNEKIEFELKNKSQELANILLNHLDKNEILIEIKHDLKKISVDLQEKNIESSQRKIILLQGKITRNIEQGIDWRKFGENFDIVHDRFLSRLTAKFPWLNKNESKLCVYIHMGMLTKEIAPLMNLSVRGVEMLRYRLRKKMQIDPNTDILVFFHQLTSENQDDLPSMPPQKDFVTPDDK
jgi:DNA-binding CsgD family transcriptional regulator